MTTWKLHYYFDVSFFLVASKSKRTFSVCVREAGEVIHVNGLPMGQNQPRLDTVGPSVRLVGMTGGSSSSSSFSSSKNSRTATVCVEKMKVKSTFIQIIN